MKKILITDDFYLYLGMRFFEGGSCNLNCYHINDSDFSMLPFEQLKFSMVVISVESTIVRRKLISFLRGGGANLFFMTDVKFNKLDRYSDFFISKKASFLDFMNAINYLCRFFDRERLALYSSYDRDHAIVSAALTQDGVANISKSLDHAMTYAYKLRADVLLHYGVDRSNPFAMMLVKDYTSYKISNN